MKYFKLQGDDIHFWTDRAHWDAEHGRARLGIARLEELAAAFPENPHIIYDQGLLWCHHAGHGRRAWQCFLDAAQMADERKIKGTRWYAARYLTKLANSADESRRWAEVVLSLAPRGHPDREEYRSFVEADSGAHDHADRLWFNSGQVTLSGDHGPAAAIAEIALSLDKGSPDIEASRRRTRAEQLRALDRADERQCAASAERFLPEDRIALVEAVAEIDRALLADPNDAVLWNFKAAWCASLERCADAIASADRAIALRPQYSRPWINKADALFKQKRDSEALACAREALEIATTVGSEFADDIDTATRLIELMNQPRRDLSLAELVPKMLQAIAVAGRSNREIFAKRTITPAFLTSGIRARIRVTGSRRAISYVPMMAQLFSDFSPEIALEAMSDLSDGNDGERALCLNAAMYLAADSCGVIQRDATRFLLLNLFTCASRSPDFVRRMYREAVLVVCANAPPPLSRLDAVLREEMRHFHPCLAHLIVDQEPLTELDYALGMHLIKTQFTGDPHEFEIDMPQIGHSVTNDPDTSAFARFARSLKIKIREWHMLIGGPPGRPRR